MWIPRWAWRLWPGEKTAVALGPPGEPPAPDMSSRPGTKHYTLAFTAPQPAIYDAHRGVLTALRDELGILAVDVEVDQPWPADVAWAIEALQPRRTHRRGLLTSRRKPTHICDDLFPADDQAFAIALAVVPYITWGTGITHDGHVVYSTYESLHEDFFELTEPQHALAISYMTTHGADPELLIQDPV